MKSRSSLVILGMCALLLLSGLLVFAAALREGNEPASVSPEGIPSPARPLPEAWDMFDLDRLRAFLGMSEVVGGRSLEAYYGRRAYPGAPPYIPHPVADMREIGGKTCLVCHRDGGYVAKFEAFAPPTPHPELLSCLQCHVPQQTEALFVASTYEAPPPPPLEQRALSSSPPLIPHDLHMRTHCLSCHAGPAAPQPIRVSHPERIYCRQCHLPAQPESITSLPDSTLELSDRHRGPTSSERLTLGQAQAIHTWLAQSKR